MAPFSATALPPASPLFRGRQAELARLKQICQDEVIAYTVIYGGHQNGKTSLLLQLEAALQGSVSVCRVDFQLIKGALPERAFAFLAAQIAHVLPLAPDHRAVADAPALLDFLGQALGQSTITRLVLLLDELGALPAETRQALANALRSFFHTRLVRPALAKLQIIFSGGIELYDLVVTEASSLHNICEEIYLADLAESEAVELIADGLRSLGVKPADAHTIGQQVYAQVSGHPYLTQRIGGLLAGAVQRGEAIGPVQIERAVRQISQGGNPLLRQIQNDLREHHMQDAARRLLGSPPRFTRLDDDMVRLELIGIAKPDDTHWAPRNPLLAEVFRERLGVAAPEPAAPPAIDTTVSGAQDVLTAKRRRLAALELQQARYGIDCPAHIVIEIEDLRREIAHFKQATAVPTAPEAAPPAQATGASAADERPPTPKRRNTGHTPRPLPDWVPTLIHIPAGPFLMGSSDSDKQAGGHEKPQHSLTLPDYWIGKTPVTNAQFRPFVEGDGYRNQQYWTKAGWAWREKEQIIKPQWWEDAKWNESEHPVVGVSWFEAVAYCRWLTVQTGHAFRLPSEAEWEKAARGPDGLIWPWGNTWETGRCNSEEAGIGKTTPVGQYPSGASPYGVLDMAGNVWEWVATKWRKSYPYQLEDEWLEVYLEEGDSGRMFRGGAYYSEQKGVRGAYRRYFYPRYRSNDQGVRVASHSPLPGSES
ncbi:formylglycine-generating enzyme family protein [Oscillochloris sp. ZM17-4]|uniref:formylglycine-generating enzyme family protein n=1 Tax=Oscillochloris sp. ZM17-4 TaxID=2866714 RepID=UPI001C73BC9E|nr:formylglycine-generating enzyme family protein [Oscillochloris sp. ZM17-4]MBX0328391.1 formylglycine-generating enzyme family protein [Oscillochloris sp. ZM17-4]